jgi:hypothetical protein
MTIFSSDEDARAFLRGLLPPDLPIDQSGWQFLEVLIAQAAGTVAASPNRTDEARQGVQALVQAISSRAGLARLSVADIQATLGKLCPLYPFC